MHKRKEVAELTGIPESTINNYVRIYKSGAIEGLIPKKYPGKCRNLLPEQEEELKETIISKNPVDVGFPANWNWTAQIISEYVYRKYGVKYSIKGMTIVLKRLDLSYTRPTYTLAKADSEKQKLFVQDFEDCKKNSLMER
jgi:transposase